MGRLIEKITTHVKELSWKGILNWILFFMLIAALVKGCLNEHRLKEALDKATQSSKELPHTKESLEAEEISRDLDAAGRERVIYEKAAPILKLVELKVEDRTKIDSLAKIVSIQSKKIISLESIKAHSEAKSLKLEQVIAENGKDTVYRYKDKYITNIITKKDSNFYSDIWQDVSVNVVDYNEKKNWFFGKNEILTKIWFNSPYIRQDGLDYVEVKQSPNLFGVDVKVEGRYMHNSKELNVGPRVDLRIGRFGLNGGYGMGIGPSSKNNLWYGADYKVY